MDSKLRGREEWHLTSLELKLEEGVQVEEEGSRTAREKKEI